MKTKDKSKKYYIYLFPATGKNIPSSGVTLYDWFLNFCNFSKESCEKFDNKIKYHSISDIISGYCTLNDCSLVSFSRFEDVYYVTFKKD